MKETNIDDLNTRLTQEESNIVDSIINDLNKDENTNGKSSNGSQQGMPQQGMPQQGMPQQGMPQQGMPQQGMPPQGMPPQGMPPQGMPPGMPPQGMPPKGNTRVVVTPEQKKILDTLNPEEQQHFLKNIRMKQMEEQNAQIKKEELTEDKIEEIKQSAVEELFISIKEPILISLIAFVFSLPQINQLFLLTKTNVLVNENGSVTVLSLLIKALLIGIIYFILKKNNVI